MTEEEIIERGKAYVRRMNELVKKISAYISERKGDYNELQIEYRELKTEIAEEAKQLRRKKNDISNISSVHAAYQDGITGSDAYGFEAKVNDKITKHTLLSLSEARYRFTKHTKKFNDD
ncbi:hypothetical protein [Faecalicatena contorta]|nr:hypothetical protein [Faecalicatena contorta]